MESSGNSDLLSGFYWILMVLFSQFTYISLGVCLVVREICPGIKPWRIDWNIWYNYDYFIGANGTVKRDVDVRWIIEWLGMNKVCNVCNCSPICTSLCFTTNCRSIVSTNFINIKFFVWRRWGEGLSNI